MGEPMHPEAREFLAGIVFGVLVTLIGLVFAHANGWL